ncbi:hypothetical protein BC332_18389 [Capsicum chinense]|nr:hypothetical protein BC332_18389 [Capsicum chinense]
MVENLLIDFVIVLRTTNAVKTLVVMYIFQLKLVLVLLVGSLDEYLKAQADLGAGTGDYVACYTYNCSIDKSVECHSYL